MHRKLPFVLLAALAVSTLSLAGCGDDTQSPPRDAIVARWNVTSFTAMDMDFIALGTTLVVDLSTEGMYSLEVTNDLIGICDGQGTSNCTSDGTYSHTSSDITLDPGTEDATTFDYSISGNVMTWGGEIDSAAVLLTFERAN